MVPCENRGASWKRVSGVGDDTLDRIRVVMTESQTNLQRRPEFEDPFEVLQEELMWRGSYGRTVSEAVSGFLRLNNLLKAEARR